MPLCHILKRSIFKIFLAEELGYDRLEMQQQHEKLYGDLNREQLKVYNSIIDIVENKKGGVLYVYGSGGCGSGKTFLWNTLCCSLLSEGKIVLPVACSGIAAVLLPGVGQLTQDFTSL